MQSTNSRETSNPDRGRRNATLDVLRAVAIICVVAFHFWSSNPIVFDNTALRPLFTQGWCGVLLFFVISGYLLGGQLLDHTERGALKVFYVRRVARIIPLYMCLIALVIALAPGSYPWQFFTMMQNFYYAQHGWSTINGRVSGDWLSCTWSLAVEEQFYLILPWLIFLIPRRHLLWSIIPLMIASQTLREWMVANGSEIPAYVLLPTNMSFLLGGVALAWLSRRFDWALPAVSLGPMAWIGRRSYAIYLFHMPMGVVGASLWGTGLLGAAITCVALLAIAQVLYVLVEAPFLSFAHRRFRYGPLIAAKTDRLARCQ